MDDDLETALNTYMLIILDMDVDEIYYQRGMNGLSFFIDPYDYYSSDRGVVDVLNYCIAVFVEHEHYEKCSDIKERIEQISYEV